MKNQAQNIAQSIFSEKPLSLRRSYKMPKTYPILPIIIFAFLIVLLLCYVRSPNILETNTHDRILQLPERPSFESAQRTKLNIKTQHFISLYCSRQQQQCQGQDLVSINQLVALMQAQRGPDMNKQQGVQGQRVEDEWEQLEEMILSVVKNEKMSTPMAKKQGFLSFVISRFINSNPYQGIDEIFAGNKHNLIWQTNKLLSMISVRSTTHITPSLLQVQAHTESKEYLSLLGLTYGPLNEILAVNLGKYCLQNGTNQIRCRKQECKGSYPIIMIIITNMKVSRIKIYGAKD